MHYGVWLLIFCPWFNTIDLFTIFEYNYDVGEDFAHKKYFYKISKNSRKIEKKQSVNCKMKLDK